MNTSSRRLAQVVSNSKYDLRVAKSKLLPPVALYKGILRAHRQLPVEMRSLGDDYVKAEFRRHQTTDNPVHVMGFLVEWKTYLDEIRNQINSKSVKGKKMDSTIYEKMSEEQLRQLYELMHASKDVWKPAEAEASTGKGHGNSDS